jgi:hypothetical protein
MCPATSEPPPHPDYQHVSLLRGVTFDPVFIIGDHRSGTTVLYQLLSLTQAFNVVTAYHVIRYNEILSNHVAGRTQQAQQDLAAQFARLGLNDRGIDGVRVTPDLPEEYGFVIDRSSRPRLRAETRAALIELGRKLRLIGGDRPLLLKNPWDVLGFAYVKEAFPQAKFIFVHRHPLKVMNSQLSAVRSLMGARNPYVSLIFPWYRELFDRPAALRVTRMTNSARFGIGARIVGRHVAKVADYYVRNVGALPARDRVEVRYEDLCARPDETIRRILTFLDLRAAELPATDGLIRQRSNPVLPEVEHRYRAIRASFADYCSAHKYEVLP